MSQPTLKITYFDICGRAELPRLALTFGGIAFEDNRVDGAGFGAIKPTLPLGQVPVLEVNGTTYSQSMALARYAGRLSGLYPTEAVDALKVDMILDTLLDALNTFVEINWGTPDDVAKAEKTKKFVGETLPKLFAFFEKSVQGKFFLGDKASLADVFIFDVVTNVLNTTFPDFKSSAYPKVTAVVASVAANSNVAAYLAKQKK